MKQEKKLAYLERELDKVREENKELTVELKALELQLARKDEELNGKDEAYNSLQAEYDKVCFDCSQAIEQAAEAELLFQQKTAEMKELSKGYKEEMEQLLGMMKRQLRKGV